jgi:hypothetical protein
MNRAVNESEWGVLNSPRKRAACIACFAALLGLVAVGVASWSTGTAVTVLCVAAGTLALGYIVRSLAHRVLRRPAWRGRSAHAAVGKTPRLLAQLGVIAIAGALICAGSWYFLGGGLEADAARGMHQIEQQVALDAAQASVIALRSGAVIDAYVQAGIAAAAFLYAHDEENYREWKQLERQLGMKAGIPAEMLR